MPAATSTGVRRRYEATAETVTHEIVVTARLLVYWKNQMPDVIAARGNVSALVKKRIACEEHLERLLAALDAAVVRERIQTDEAKPANGTARKQISR